MQEKKEQNITKKILLLCFGILLFGVGYRLGEYNVTGSSSARLLNYNVLNSKQESASAKNVDFAIFWETWDKLQQKYVDQSKIDPQKMLYGAVKGMVASVNDPYTFFLTPDENKQSKDDLGGKFEGIGAQLGLKNNRVVVIAPLKGSPAERAGVRAGDYINKVDGQSTRNFTLVQTVGKIRGKDGTSVTLTLERGGKEFDVKIQRKQIIVSSVESSTEKSVACSSSCPQVAYIKITQFGDNTNDEWDKAIDQVHEKWQQGSIKGMVLDLRDNPGGFLESSVYIASEFLDRGQLVVKQETIDGNDRDYTVYREGKLHDIPLVVLINQGSASASEILSGALRDQKRASLVGAKSFGKGSVQEALDLQKGAGLHVTVAKWILPSGEWINGKGITPQYQLENKLPENSTLTRDKDAQLEKAIELATQ